MQKNNNNLDVQSGSKINSLEFGKTPDTTEETIETYLKELKAHQQEWAQKCSMADRIQLLVETLANINKYQDEWIHLDSIARHSPAEEHWSTHLSGPLGPISSALLIKGYLANLKNLEEDGTFKSPAKTRQEGDRVIVDSFPLTSEDKQAFPGVRAEIHLMKGTRLEDFPSLQARIYKDKSYHGGIALVLCAGNVPSLTFRDLIHMLYNEKKLVILKSNPVLEYMGPLMSKILEPFIKRGFVRIVMGGSLAGKILANHPLIDDIMMTGSDKTFEAIVYGGGEDGQKNKSKDFRVTTKHVYGELGSVSPAIVVPGDWEEKDFEHYADLLLQMIIVNNGYACLATRVVVLPKNWDGSKKLLSMIIDRMSKVQAAIKYYPGTDKTIADALASYPNALKFGKNTESTQPLIFATELSPDKNEIAFTREFWMTFSSQVYIDGKSTEEYLQNAVNFCNEKLWGNLSATLIIDPVTQKKLEENKFLQKILNDLHYGNVTINTWPVITALATQSSEGAYPGSTYNNIQSGNCVTRNSFFLDKIEKTVFFASFRI